MPRAESTEQGLNEIPLRRQEMPETAETCQNSIRFEGLLSLRGDSRTAFLRCYLILESLNRL